ncbi:hypothetical protein RvY_01253-2 [Ramazzottius varieornatus]|uniref:Ig-like domain-containing protein n=1 Tax=Ramazzottius varieornatus TaxID=947166 RepID=A0A1D1UFM3_RAMVA|nr:hypothetical protein RvY_01253-2 [Ramazzottius varieornatus]
MESVFYLATTACLLAGILVDVTAQQNPTITFIEKEKVADIGSTVELRCAVQFVADFPVMWIRLPDTPLTIRGSKIVPDNRYSIRYDESSMTYLLQIQDLQESDDGIYRCQVQVTSTTKVTAEVPLSIRRQPVISDDSTRDQIVTKGEDIDLFCNASGNPHPKLSWRRQGAAVLPNGGAISHGNHLRILDIQREHRGTYICTADNAVGGGAQRLINIQVEFAPVIRVPRARIGQALYYERELECIVEAFPAANVEWSFDGRKIVDDAHYHVSSFTKANDATEMKLRIKNIQKRHYGAYECVAHSRLGSARGKVEFYETSYVVGDYDNRALFAGLTHSASSTLVCQMFFVLLVSIILCC